MARLTLTGVTKSYGGQPVLHGIDLDIASGAFVVIVGPSGCGNFTLVRMIAGLDSVTPGETVVDGQRITEMNASRRGVAMVFLNCAPCPHRTLRGNLSSGLRTARPRPPKSRPGSPALPGCCK